MDSWASVHFDLLRGVAALLVLLEHGRNLFFLDYSNLTVHRGWMFVPYVICGAGHQSVVFFFVLSGYFIGGTVLRALERNEWSWSGYLLRRFVRLWIVLIPALLLCLLWDRLGIHLGHAPLLYTGHVPNHMLGDTTRLLSAPIFLGNASFLQGIVTPTFGSDGALWSLANEFWYYILFPLGIISVWPQFAALKRIVCAMLFLGIAWLVHGPILWAFPMWLAGVGLFKMRPPTFSARAGTVLRVLGTVVYFALFFAVSRIHLPWLWGDFLLTLGTLGYLWLLLSGREPFRAEDLRVRGSREMARFSYTLYASHTPALVFAASLLIGDSRWYPTARTLTYGVGIALATLAYAYGLAFVTEFRTDGLRMLLERVLGMTVGPPALPSNPLSENAAKRPLEVL